MRGMAWKAVNQIWSLSTRRTTRRPAVGSVPHAMTIRKRRSARAPTSETHRATAFPIFAIGAINLRLEYYDCRSCCNPSSASVYSGNMSSARLYSSAARSMLPRSAYMMARE